MIGNQKKENIPHLFKYVQLVLTGNTKKIENMRWNLEAKVIRIFSNMG